MGSVISLKEKYTYSVHIVHRIAHRIGTPGVHISQLGVHRLSYAYALTLGRVTLNCPIVKTVVASDSVRCKGLDCECTGLNMQLGPISNC